MEGWECVKRNRGDGGGTERARERRDGVLQGAVGVELRAAREICFAFRDRMAYVPAVFVKIVTSQQVFEHVPDPARGKVAKVGQSVRLGELLRQRRFARIIIRRR